MQRRKFSREFKLEAVRLIKDRGVAVAQAARDLDVHENVLRKWVRELSGDPQHGRVFWSQRPSRTGVKWSTSAFAPRAMSGAPEGDGAWGCSAAAS